MDRSHLKFPETVEKQFSFLKEYGFKIKLREQTVVKFESKDVFITIYHDRVSFEIGLQIGLLSSGSSSGYGLGSVIKFTDPELGNKFRCYTTSSLEGVKKGVVEIATLLETYGDKVLRGDAEIFKWLNNNIEQYWAEREAARIRPKAEEAFRTKEYSKALDLYRSIENCLTSAEEKKIKYAMKKVSVAKQECAEKEV